MMAIVMAIVPFPPKPFSYDDDGGNCIVTRITKKMCMTHQIWYKIEADNMRNEEKGYLCTGQYCTPLFHLD